MRVAVLDVGSNSIQLLVADVAGDGWRRVAAAERICRLGAGLAPGKPFDPAASARTLRAVRCLGARARALGAQHVWAVGTRPFRVATDAAALAARLETALGEPFEVLSETREADLGFRGAVSACGVERGAVLTVDIGGGSTEIVAGTDGRAERGVSLPVGAVVLTERHLCHDPPAGDELLALEAAVRAEIEGARAVVAGDPARPLVGSGGTVTTLGAIALRLDRYRPEAVHGTRIAAAELAAIANDLAARSVAERARLPGLDPARAPVIVAGAALATEIMRASGATEIVVSDRGVRHAVLCERSGLCAH
jgi:exopolyphosphatase/guanosine-5'-triphosphate,3'-diphosphate pyrophosphatase